LGEKYRDANVIYFEHLVKCGHFFVEDWNKNKFSTGMNRTCNLDLPLYFALLVHRHPRTPKNIASPTPRLIYTFTPS
jgi:hypothetical protein